MANGFSWYPNESIEYRFASHIEFSKAMDAVPSEGPLRLMNASQPKVEFEHLESFKTPGRTHRVSRQVVSVLYLAPTFYEPANVAHPTVRDEKRIATLR